MAQRETLTFEAAQKLGGAIQRLSELAAAPVITPTSEAEQKGLVQFLQAELFKYANELVGSWFVMHTEYEPLIGCVASLLSRANGVLSRNAAAQQAPAPENVIKLDRSSK
jgi:hypothetical protein